MILYGTKLAQFQDRLIALAESGANQLSRKDIKKLNNNLWINWANRTAISNLTVRNLCLQLYFRTFKTGKYLETNVKLWRQIQKLSSNGQLWAEGYSYWLYTKKALELLDYSNSLVDYNINFIPQIDKNWIASGWIDQQNKLRPAPFGDVRLTYINHNKADKTSVKEFFTCDFFTKTNHIYQIKPYPVGLNGHCEAEEKIVNVKRHIDYYKGYDKKYKGPLDEWHDLLRWRRIKSIF